MDLRLDEAAPDTLAATVSDARRVHLLLVAGHPPLRDPRIAWQADCAVPGDAFICIGLHADERTPAPVARQVRPHVLEITAYRYRAAGMAPEASRAWDRCLLASSLAGMLADMERRDPAAVCAAHGIANERLPWFLDLCRHFLASARALVDLGTSLSHVDSIIAADIDSLLPALVLKSWFKVPLLYDAHEVWPESVPGFSRGEVDFWSEFERLLAREAEARFVASVPSAAHMSQRFGYPFEALSNCEPLAGNPPRPRPVRTPGQPVQFLYQGILARQRGLLPLVEAWPLLQSDAMLVIRGPDSDPEFVSALKRAAGALLDNRIVFAPSVTEAELVEAAAAADVGLIPYEPVNVNNLGACPNKLSQYLAAGLPILTNDLPFVRQLVEQAHCGLAVDFSDRAALARAIDTLAGDATTRAAMATRARAHFESTFHWEEQGKPFYAALERLLPPPAADPAGAAPCRLAWHATPRAPAEEFAALALRHNLGEVFPLQSIDSIGRGDANHLIDLRQFASVPLHPDPEGNSASAGFQLPRVVDVTHVLIEFDHASAPGGVLVEAHNEGGPCGSSPVGTPQAGVLLASLSGNPTSWIKIRATRLVPGAPLPVILTCRCLSFGIVRDQDMGAGMRPAPPATHGGSGAGPATRRWFGLRGGPRHPSS